MRRVSLRRQLAIFEERASPVRASRTRTQSQTSGLPLRDRLIHILVQQRHQKIVRRLSRFRKLKKQAYTTNSNPAEATLKFKEEYGYLPPHDWKKQAVLGKEPDPAEVIAFTEYLQKFAPHDFWLKVQQRLEFGEQIAGFKRKTDNKRKQKT